MDTRKYITTETTGHRRSVRLPKYDYSSVGAYFITICTQDKRMIFEREEIRKMVEKWWMELSNKFPGVVLDEYVIMPNHLHGIIVIEPPVGVHLRVRPQGSAVDNRGQTHRSAPTEFVIKNEQTIENHKPKGANYAKNHRNRPRHNE